MFEGSLTEHLLFYLSTSIFEGSLAEKPRFGTLNVCF